DRVDGPGITHRRRVDDAVAVAGANLERVLSVAQPGIARGAITRNPAAAIDIANKCGRSLRRPEAELNRRVRGIGRLRYDRGVWRRRDGVAIDRDVHSGRWGYVEALIAS